MIPRASICPTTQVSFGALWAVITPSCPTEIFECMLCSRCSASLSQHAFKLPNWLMSAPLNSACCSACAAPQDDKKKSKWIWWILRGAWDSLSCNDLEIIPLHLLKVVYVPNRDSASTLCEGVNRGSMFFSFSSFSKITDMKFVLKPNTKKTSRELQDGEK